MIPAAIYLRVSREDQHPENQRPALEQMAQARGYDVVTEFLSGGRQLRAFMDHGISGSKGADDRPGLAALLEAAARGEIRAVFVWALDRLSRDGSIAGGLRIVGELDHYRCAVFSLQETWLDTSGPFRTPLIALALKMAEEERKRLIERSRAGVERARAAGHKPGRPREEIPSVVVNLARHYHEHYESWRGISQMLAEMGHYQPARMLKADRKRGKDARMRTRRPWPPATLRAAVQEANERESCPCGDEKGAA